ncbi:hypothetical protein, partial [Staphylococcus aureus]
MIRRPPRSTRKESSAAADVYKRQGSVGTSGVGGVGVSGSLGTSGVGGVAVSYTHLRAHETLSDLVSRLLLEKTLLRS